MNFIKYYLRLLAMPLLFAALLLSLALVWRVLELPPTEELMRTVGQWLRTYGLWALLICAYIEGMLLVGSYFPGVFVIFVSVLAAQSWWEAGVAVAVGTLGLVLAHMANYGLGRYGWYRVLAKFGLSSAIEDSRARLIRRGPIALFLTYWSPSNGAIVDTAAGIMRMPFQTFVAYSIGASVFWNVLVGCLVYGVGERTIALAAPGSSGGLPVIMSILILWVIVLLVMDFKERKRKVHV